MKYTMEEILGLTVSRKKDATHYISLDKEDGTKEILYYLNCSESEAYDVFVSVVNERVKEFRKAESQNKWRVVRLFGANDEQLAQES